MCVWVYGTDDSADGYRVCSSQSEAVLASLPWAHYWISRLQGWWYVLQIWILFYWFYILEIKAFFCTVAQTAIEVMMQHNGYNVWCDRIIAVL